MATPIKILQVVGAMNIGGTERMLMSLYRNIDRSKVQFDFISYERDCCYFDKEIEQLGGRVIYVSKSASVKEHYEVMKQFGPYQAVHAHTLFHCGIVMLAAYLAGVPIRISHAHTTHDVQHTVYKKTMQKLINNFSTDLLACSRQSGVYLFGKKSIFGLFPNCIDEDHFLYPPIKREDFFMQTNLVIGHVGRFIPAKNHRFLLRILTALLEKRKDVLLYLVGDGDLKKEVEAKAGQEGLMKHVKFLGQRSDIPALLHEMDVFVFPSIHEGLGLVLLEAQASGLPCVVSEAIQPEADVGLGLIKKLSLQDHPSIWADAILEMANKREKNGKKIKQAFDRTGYSASNGLQRAMEVYQINEKAVDLLV